MKLQETTKKKSIKEKTEQEHKKSVSKNNRKKERKNYKLYIVVYKRKNSEGKFVTTSKQFENLRTKARPFANRVNRKNRLISFTNQNGTKITL